MIIEKPSRNYGWYNDVTTQDIEVNRGEGIGAHKVLAGSPIDENGNIANDETAIGLLLETVSDENPNGKIIVAGDVDALGAKNASGIELSEAAKNAMIGITWRDPDYVVEMQSGGGKGYDEYNVVLTEEANTVSFFTDKRYRMVELFITAKASETEESAICYPAGRYEAISGRVPTTYFGAVKATFVVTGETAKAEDNGIKLSLGFLNSGATSVTYPHDYIDSFRVALTTETNNFVAGSSFYLRCYE